MSGKTETKAMKKMGRLQALRSAHRDLDETIRDLSRAHAADSLTVRRLKKRKLQIKDSISKLEGELIPYLDA